MATERAQLAKWRFIRAYFLTFRVLTRYFFLYLAAKFLGKERVAYRWERAHVRTARQIKESILQLKGIYIKVGQMVSIMTHFLPTPITKELEGLQDAVPPAPFSDIQKRLEDEFGKSPTEYFSKFETVPIASASLGQVHAAWLPSGEKVAVKVQYPGIGPIVRKDLKALKRIIGLLHMLFPRYGLKKTYLEIREVILEELDFTVEGKNLETLQQNLATEKDILFPKVYWEHSSHRVLTLAFVEGTKIRDVEGIRELGLETTEVAKKIIHVYCRQIFLDGVYHADPHPGNFLVRAREADVEVYYPPAANDPDGVGQVKLVRKRVPQIVMMDFGAVARISDPMRRGIGRFIEGLIKRDNRVISQAMKEMGFIAKTQNEEVFDRIVEFFYERLKDVKIEDVKNFRFESFDQLGEVLEFRKMNLSFKDLFQSFNVPKDWALLERTLILLMGLTTHLDAKLNPLTIIVPYAEEFVLGKDHTFADLILETLKEVALGYLKLPTEIQRTLRRLDQGEVQIQLKDSQENTRRMSRALNRLTYSLLTLGTFSLSYLLQNDGSFYYRYGYYLSGVFGLLLAFQLIKRR